jgi:uncharacterized protein YidB (DUF937 family)
MGILDEMLKGAAGAAAGKSGLGQSLGLNPQHGAMADAVLGMLTSGEHGGLPGLQQSLQSKGLGDVVASWIGTGQNQPIGGHQLESALGSAVVQQLAAKAGIDPKMASAALAAVLPLVVDKLTPQGSVPAQQSMLEIAAGFLGGKR